MILREYQRKGVNGIRASLKTNRSALFVLCTGGGKTVIFSHIARCAYDKGNVIFIIAHRRKLLKQAAEKLDGLPHSFVVSGKSHDVTQRVFICSVGTLVNRMDEMPEPQVIIIDEAHRATSAQYRKIIDRYPNAKVIGFTATPQRTDGTGLGQVFEDMVTSVSIEWLIENDYLSKYKYYSHEKTLDISGVKITAGDYNKKDHREAVKNSNIIGNAVEHYREKAHNLPAICFCDGIDSAKDAAAKFTEGGYNAIAVSGGSSEEEQDDALLGLSDGRYHVVCACDLISEGVDVPLCTVAILLRKTKSIIIFLQQVGRVLRKHNDKLFAIILDHVGNYDTHGMPCQERDWCLNGKRKNDCGRGVKWNRCEICFEVYNVIEAHNCGSCGEVEQAKRTERAKTIAHKAGKLKEIDIKSYKENLRIAKQAKLDKEKKRKNFIEEIKATCYDDLLKIEKDRGYKRGWAVIANKRRIERILLSYELTGCDDIEYFLDIVKRYKTTKDWAIKLLRRIIDQRDMDTPSFIWDNWEEIYG
jgi:DNA repair protein RadD